MITFLADFTWHTAFLGMNKRRFRRGIPANPEVKARKLTERPYAALSGSIGGPVGNAVMVLNEYKPSVIYTLLSNVGPMHAPCFKMQAEFEGNVFEGFYILYILSFVSSSSVSRPFLRACTGWTVSIG